MFTLKIIFNSLSNDIEEGIKLLCDHNKKQILEKKFMNFVVAQYEFVSNCSSLSPPSYFIFNVWFLKFKKTMDFIYFTLTLWREEEEVGRERTKISKTR